MADEDGGWLTITDIARRLERPPSTVTYWRNQCRDLLETRPDEHGHPCYRLAAFEEISRLMAEHRPMPEVRVAIGQTAEVPAGGAGIAIQLEMLALLRQIAADVQRIAERLDPPAEG